MDDTGTVEAIAADGLLELANLTGAARYAVKSALGLEAHDWLTPIAAERVDPLNRSIAALWRLGDGRWILEFRPHSALLRPNRTGPAHAAIEQEQAGRWLVANGYRVPTSAIGGSVLPADGNAPDTGEATDPDPIRAPGPMSASEPDLSKSDQGLDPESGPRQPPGPNLLAEHRAIAVLTKMLQDGERPTVTEIARRAQCNRGHLSRCKGFRALWATCQATGKVRRGSKSRDGQIEAYED